MIHEHTTTNRASVHLEQNKQASLEAIIATLLPLTPEQIIDP
jgi:hypothetical protein